MSKVFVTCETPSGIPITGTAELIDGTPRLCWGDVFYPGGRRVELTVCQMAETEHRAWLKTQIEDGLAFEEQAAAFA